MAGSVVEMGEKRPWYKRERGKTKFMKESEEMGEVDEKKEEKDAEPAPANMANFIVFEHHFQTI
jgi:hypothetical protein